MKTSFYLKVNKNGTVGVTKNRPGLDYDQVSILMNLELPDILFQKPHITASIKVDSKNAMPFNIDAETVNNVKQAIETATGIQVKLSIEDKGQE